MNNLGMTCIATVTCDDFLLGTLVMLDSFLRHNSEFRGDVIVFHDGLSDASARLLTESFPSVLLRRFSSDLTKRLDRLTTAIPALTKQRLQFGSLEVMKLSGYDKVLFCDSDLLFHGNVMAFFERPEPLLCCGDGPHHRGNARQRDSFREVMNVGGNSVGILTETFNTGFMVLDATVLTNVNYEALLSMIEPSRWAVDTTGHTDQLIFNLAFAGQQKILSPTYNYVLQHRSDIYAARGHTLGDAIVIHFNGPAKPWAPRAYAYRLPGDPAQIAGLDMWNRAYIAYLTRMSLRKDLRPGPRG